MGTITGAVVMCVLYMGADSASTPCVPPLLRLLGCCSPHKEEQRS